jgi:small subunit ribosomal protein S14
MAKRSMIARENVREIKSARARKLRNKLREIIKSSTATYDEKMSAVEKLNKRPRDESPSRRQRRCKVCGRPRAVYRKFGLCRIHLREAANRGDVPGLVKDSW